MPLDAFFKPRSIAVIGASREPEKVGHKIVKNLIEYGFKGRLFPINPKADEILGLKCYSSVLDVPEQVDLAVIVVPGKIVPIIAEECGKKGVKGIVVISAGFSETGREGTQLERELLAICRKYNIRMQGPNCLGLINTQNRMNATFASAKPTTGNIAFISQSGALGSTILNWALQNEVGFTSFISLGNEADLTAADFLESLTEDEQTRAVGLYIEGVKDGPRFIEVSKKISMKKPVIVLKSGTTDVGVRAVSSHTGSLAGSDVAFSAAFRKAGVIRVDKLEELFELVLAFENQPLPRDKNVLIITNGGGPGILVADACEKMGLNLPLLELNLREELRCSLPPHASLNNPIDILGDADEKRYELALKIGLKSQNVDGIIVILTPQAMTPSDRVAEVIAEVRKSSNKPIVTAFMGLDDDSSAIKTLLKNDIPNYPFPESTAFVLKKMYEYASILKRPKQEPMFQIQVDHRIVRNTLDTIRKDDRLTSTIEEAFKIADSFGIPVPKVMVAHSSKQAGDIADLIGYPVAMKVISPEILHKTDVGGVVLNITSRAEVERNYENIMNKVHSFMPQARILGISVQQMVPQGKEVIVGAVRDPQFGPLMMFGLGGIYVNFLRDVSYRLCPITRSEAEEMIEETKAYTLLRGVRGEPTSDINSLVDVILRISQIMTDFREIVEMEINPLFVYNEKKGCVAVDIKMAINKLA
ncbi:acetate--CoA ligase family protein [Candidatus Bathyarchaeota archaeon]|nr:acetate--CoA ligase family protein [Candidatus Bathyarchaeota archaeon]